MKIKLTFFVFLLIVICYSGTTQPPVGYYNSATGKSCADLKTSLKNIIASNSPHTYDELWAEFKVADVKAREVGSGSAKVIYDIYSDKPGPGNDPYNFTPGTGAGGQQDSGFGGNVEGQYYNREHVIPLSWFNGNTGSTGTATDYLFIFPADKSLNNRRGNLPYGKTGNATFTSLNGSKIGPSSVAGISGTVFEPIDSFKGDIARTFLYFVTRYENSMPAFGSNADAAKAFEPNTFPSVDTPYLRMMISWNSIDPVSTKEIERNNSAYLYQGNRNPYIDHPEYVDYVWNNTCTGLNTLPVDIISFGGRLAGGQVRLEWNVANEVGLNRYEIEKSLDGTGYSVIGKVLAAGLHTYTFGDNTDNNQGREVYYRLKKINKDGRFDYSAVFALQIPFNTRFSVYPNPARSSIQLQVNGPVNGMMTAQLADLSGKVLRQKTGDSNGGSIRFATANINAGTYILKLFCNGQQFVQKVVVVK